MSILQAKLMGNPKLYMNSQQVFLPFRKAEALLYYLIVKKQASRDVIVDLLWGDTEEDVAKKNLRNAVYIIRKAFGVELIISPQRHILMLNDQIELNLDIDNLKKNIENNHWSPYEGDFLEGFQIKEADYFEHWVIESRESLREEYLHTNMELLSLRIHEKKYLEAEKICRELIGIDEFNEALYRDLIYIYSQDGKYGKCTDVFNELNSLLSKELSITPDEKTIEAFEKAMERRTLKAMGEKSTEADFFFGRNQELIIINEKLEDFRKNKKASHLVVIGEAGIGKSKLVYEGIKRADKRNLYIINAMCYQAEEGYALKPWNSVFEELGKIIHENDMIISDNLTQIVSCVFPTFSPECQGNRQGDLSSVGILQYQVAEKAIVDIIKRVSEKVKLVLRFEDIQWMDDMSLSLLRDCVYQNQGNNFLCIMTCRNEYRRKLENCFTELGAYGFLNKIYLERMSESETLEFSRQYLPDYKFTKELDATIIKETECNTFFLVEFLNGLRDGNLQNMISGKTKDIISSRIMNISEEGKKILNISSLFFDRIVFEDLFEISGKSEDELSDLLEELQEKYLIKEFADSAEVWFCFTHQKLREFIYSEISASKRRILHNRIAKHIEGKLENTKTDTLLYSKLIHHFENGGNKLSALKYRLKDLNEYVHVSHELFPVLDKSDLEDKKCFYLSKDYTAQSILEIRKLVEEMENSTGWDKNLLAEYEVEYLYFDGRNAIRQGAYERGLDRINQMIQKALALGEYNYALKGYRSIAYYCINTHNLTDMGRYLELARRTADEYFATDETTLIHRLSGILEILRGEYDTGEEQLRLVLKSIEEMIDKERFALVEAGTYYYLGESKKRQGQYKDALVNFEKAIEICKKNSMMNSATIFFANATQTAYLMGDSQTALYYFEHAVRIYKQYDYPWGKTVALGYGALIRLEEGRYEECLELIKMAEETANTIKNPIDLGVIFRVKAQMAYEKKLKARAASAFRHYIEGDVETYCRQGIAAIQQVKNPCELQALLDLLEIIGA